MKRKIILTMMLIFSVCALKAAYAEESEYFWNFEDYNLDESFIGGAFSDYGGGVKKIAADPNDPENRTAMFGGTAGLPGFWVNLCEKGRGLSGKIYVSADVTFQNPTHSVRIPEVYSRTENGDILLCEAIETGGLIGLTGNTGSVYLKELTSGGQRYKVELVTDTALNEFSVYIDHTAVSDSNGNTVFKFRNNGDYVNALFFGYKYIKNEDGAYTYVDNITVRKITEPEYTILSPIEYMGRTVYTITDTANVRLENGGIRNFDIISDEKYPNYSFSVRAYSEIFGCEVKDGLLYVNGSLISSGYVGSYSAWQIREDKTQGTFSLYLDGRIAGKLQRSLSADETPYLNIKGNGIKIGGITASDGGNAPKTLTSDIYEVSDREILNTPYGITDYELLSALKAPDNTVLQVFSKNGIIRKGRLEIGDYVKSGDSVYTLPDLKLTSVRSQYCNIDLKNGKVTNAAGKDLAEIFLKSIKCADRGAQIYIENSDVLVVEFSDKTVYRAKIDAFPEDALIFSENFESGYEDNFYTSGASVKNGRLTLENSGIGIKTAKRYFDPPKNKLILECELSYDWNSKSPVFFAPYLEAQNGKLARIKAVDGKLYCGSVTASGIETDKDTGVLIEKNKVYKIKWAVDAQTKTHSLWVDGELKATEKLLDDFYDISNVHFKLWSENNEKTGSMYVDNLKISVPCAHLSYAEETKNGIRLYVSDEFSCGIPEIKLYDGDREIPYTYENMEQTLELFFQKPKSESVTLIFNGKEYKIPMKKYGTEVISICADTDGKTVRFSADIFTKEQNGFDVIFAVYKKDGALSAIYTKTVQPSQNGLAEVSASLADESMGEGVYGRLFIWDISGGLKPMCDFAVSNLR